MSERLVVIGRDSQGNTVTKAIDIPVRGTNPINVWADPVRWGWPGPGNTGPRKALRPRITVDTSTNGDVIDGWDVDGSIIARGDDVIINDCAALRSVVSGAYVIRLYGDNLTVNHTRTTGGSISIYSTGGRYVLNHCEMRGCGDGPRIEQDNVEIRDSWIHHLQRTDGSHNDTIQIRGGRHTRIVHNTLQAWRPDTNDPMNGVVQWGSQLSDGGNYDDLWFNANLCDGGNYTLMLDPAATNQVFLDNRFGRHYRYGLVKGGLPQGALWRDNVWDADNTPIAA